LVNVIVDLEVLHNIRFTQERYPHQHWHFHTLLGGAIVGIIFGTAAYWIKPVRRFFEWGMRLVRIRYKPNAWKMILSGVLGVWLHAAIDAIYHYDVRLFWPSKARNLARPLWRLFSKNMKENYQQVEFWCLMCLIGAVILYVFAVRSFAKARSAEGTSSKPKLG
jgi:H+/Cl- antiporter ClcA